MDAIVTLPPYYNKPGWTFNQLLTLRQKLHSRGQRTADPIRSTGNAGISSISPAVFILPLACTALFLVSAERRHRMSSKNSPWGRRRDSMAINAGSEEVRQDLGCGTRGDSEGNLEVGGAWTQYVKCSRTLRCKLCSKNNRRAWFVGKRKNTIAKMSACNSANNP